MDPRCTEDDEMRAQRPRADALLTLFAFLALLAIPRPFSPSLALLSAQTIDTSLYAGMRYRMVGPFRGGRSTAVTGIAGKPHTFLMGGTGGGLWRTDDAGHHWTSLTDKYFTVGAVGAVDVADSDPNVIYVGTGSACIRGNVSTGRGLWKSTDSGTTWRFIGLPESGAIGDIAVHPTNPDLVYVAALGHPFGKNRERGVYRSKDGGATWEQVFFQSDSTGAVDFAMNPANPREIYVAMWRAERKPWTLISGSSESGVYKTTDGGDTWTKLAGGLPSGVVGKIGLTVSPANPSRVWAIVEAEPGGGLYRSDNRGESWTRVSTDRRILGRPWYYHHVEADPKDENSLYALNVDMFRSVDGGRTFEEVQVPHGDVHDIWINPEHPEIFAVADDGGVVVTVNHGRTFSSLYNQPTAELYDVEVDNQHSYRIYGSQQDNTTISVRHNLAGHSLRPQQEWSHASGCETGPVALHRDHPDVIWSGCYGGVINVMDVGKDTRRNVNLYPENQGQAPKDRKHRFQWVAPIVVSPHDPNTVYHASQYVHRTRDAGRTWETISPDLTTNNKAYQEFPGGPIHADNSGVEVFNTVFALVVSPHDAGTLWAGSDDGRVHLTRDDGKTWTDISPRAMPALGTVNRIDVSSHAPGRAFVAVQRYRMDDWRPYIFRTDDFGATWTLLTDGRNGLPPDHPVRVVREDPVRRGLLYAGTEFGVFVSFDDGARWQPLQLNLPATPVTDMKVHRDDLVLSTQGRSFWLLDDLTPLRELAASPATRKTRLYTPRRTARGVMGDVLGELDLTRPDRLPFGALIHYVLTEDAPEVTLEVADAAGAVVRRWSSDSAKAAEARLPRIAAAKGFHRVVWNLTYPGARPPRGAAVGGGFGGGGLGIKAPPGEYSVRLTAGGETQMRPFTVTGDPRDPEITQADYDEQFRLARSVRDTLEALYRAIESLRTVRDQAQGIVDRAKTANRPLGRLSELNDSLKARLSGVEGDLTQTRAGQGLAVPSKLDAQYGALFNYLAGTGGYGPGSAEGRPTRGAYDRQRDLDPQWSVIHQRLDRVLREDLAAFNAEVTRLGLAGILTPPAQ